MDETTILNLGVLSLGSFIGVLVVTIAYFFVLRPDDDDIDFETLQSNPVPFPVTVQMNGQGGGLDDVQNTLDEIQATLEPVDAPELVAQLEHIQTQLNTLNTRIASEQSQQSATLNQLIQQVNQQANALASTTTLLESADLAALNMRLNNLQLLQNQVAKQEHELKARLNHIDSLLDKQATLITENTQQEEQYKDLLDKIDARLKHVDKDVVEIKERRKVATKITDIKGIGPSYAQKLYDVGVRDLRQLANFTPDELRDLIDTPSWRRIKAESWIEQAKELVAIQDALEGKS